MRERRVPAACRADVPLAPLTHCKIGGTARVLCEAGSEDDVAEAVEYRRRAGLTDDEVFVLGGGANVLINDVRDYGLVIKLSEHFNAIEVDEAAGTARIQAGIYTPRLVREAGRRGWEGFQFLAGVPGSLGGAVVMNAGVRELSTWDLVVAVEGITWNGDRVRVEREMVRPSYRRGDLPRDLIVTIVECKVRGGDAVAIHRKARELASSRKETQPLRWPSWGSTFKNPSGASSDGVTAGALIDSAGLKGFRVGDAAISEKHANFIVNLGAATAADALACIRAAYEAVRDRHGVRLEPEVRLIGFAPADLAFLERA
ncbi:MAG: UDP-N-acetylmuramate dehydrogenase [Gemmatimonadota bacterium]